MIFWQLGTGLLLVEFLSSLFIISKIGFLKTFFLWLLSAFLGAYLIQAQGLAVLAKAQQSFQKGGLPASAVSESLCIFIAGLFFILPGFISDLFGFALLIPPIRNRLKARSAMIFDLKENPDDGIIEGEYERVPEETDRLNR